MFINCNKTKCITVGTKQKLSFQNEQLYWTINSGSFTKVSETQYTVMVTPNLGGKHSNVLPSHARCYPYYLESLHWH
jgi:hypothetical protein